MKTYPHYFIDLARQLRRRQTVAEKLLWNRLRRKQEKGIKFRRQHRIGRYVVDFYSAQQKLIVELEGAIHDLPKQREYDQVRFETLTLSGYHILKFRNEEVLENLDLVLETIRTFEPSPPSPLPNWERGGFRRRRKTG